LRLQAKQPLAGTVWSIIVYQHLQGGRHRPGIVGIERSLQQKHKETDSSINQSFQDLKKLMEKVKFS
jgi:hypothetical protein